jgi:2'-5' RNA ligase
VTAAKGPTGHLTVVAYEGLDRDVATEILQCAAISCPPFFLRAHGYGFFVGELGDASLHIPVVRDESLNGLHASVRSALAGAGATLAGWTEPDLWSPHITVVEGGLGADALAVAVAALARRHHPSWRMPVRGLEIVGGRHEAAGTRHAVTLAG